MLSAFSAVVLLLAVAPAVQAQEPFQQPGQPAYTSDPDTFTPVGEWDCYVPYPEAPGPMSGLPGFGDCPTTLLEYGKWSPSDCPVPVPPPYPFTPYYVPGPCDDYPRPDPDKDYTVYEPVVKGGYYAESTGWLWRLRVYGEFVNQSDIKGSLQGTELQTFRTGFDVGADIHVLEDSEVQFEIGTRYSRYDFEVFAITPQQEVYNDYLNARFFLQDLEVVNLMVQGSIRVGEEENASFSDGLYGMIGGGIAIEPDDNLSIGVAVNVQSYLEGGGVAVFPQIWIDWQIDDEWSLNTDWEHTAGMALSYNPSVWESYRIKAFYDFWQFRNQPFSPTFPAMSNAAIMDERLGFSIGTELRSSELIYWTVDAGVYAVQKFRANSTLGSFLLSFDTDPAAFVQFGVKVLF